MLKFPVVLIRDQILGVGCLCSNATAGRNDEICAKYPKGTQCDYRQIDIFHCIHRTSGVRGRDTLWSVPWNRLFASFSFRLNDRDLFKNIAYWIGFSVVGLNKLICFRHNLDTEHVVVGAFRPGEDAYLFQTGILNYFKYRQ